MEGTVCANRYAATAGQLALRAASWSVAGLACFVIRTTVVG
jgi:hypothetical protein